MNARGAWCELCWSGATGLAVAAFILVLAALDVSTGIGWSGYRLGLVIVAGVALATMIVLIGIAFRIERRRGSPDVAHPNRP